MARILTATLLAAQQADSPEPAIKLEAREFVGAAPRPRWARLYTGAEADDSHALAALADGSLSRMRIDTALVRLYRQRITTPLTASSATWGSWTLWRTATKLVSVAADGSATLHAFCVSSSTPTQIYQSTSTNSGASWGAWALRYTAAGTVSYIAAGMATNGDVLLLWSVTNTLYYGKYSVASGWYATGSPFALDSITGLACAHRNDFNCLISGTETGTKAPGVWQAIYGSGVSQALDTWSAQAVVVPSTPAEGLVFDAPFIAPVAPDYITFTEAYSGTGGYNRPFWGHNIGYFVNNRWREPVPFNATANWGLALAWATPYLWATSPFGVWYADMSAPLLDLSSDLVSFTMLEEPNGSRAEFVLNNEAGKYNSPGTGSLAAIRVGSELLLSPGFQVPGQGRATATGTRLYIDAIELTTTKSGRSLSLSKGLNLSKGGPQQTLTLHARGPWAVLERTSFRSARSWPRANQSVQNLAFWLLARGGFDGATLWSSAAFTTFQPEFAVQPGESAATALRRLLEKVSDHVRFDAGAGNTTDPQSSEVKDWDIGLPGGHQVLGLSWHTTSQPVTHAHVWAGAPATGALPGAPAGVLGEAVDWSPILDLYARPVVEHDQSLTTEAEADNRAAATLRKSAIQAAAGRLQIPAHVGLELYDILSITEPALGLSAALRRTIGIRWAYKDGRFSQEVTLAAV